MSSPSEAAQERRLEFLEAFALGRDPPLRPDVHDLERQPRHGPRWFRATRGCRRRSPAASPRSTRSPTRRSRRHPGGARARRAGVRQPTSELYGSRSRRIFAARAASGTGPLGVDRPRRAGSSACRRSGRRTRSRSPRPSAPTILALPIALAALGPLGYRGPGRARPGERPHRLPHGRGGRPERPDAVMGAPPRPARRRLPRPSAARSARRRCLFRPRAFMLPVYYDRASAGRSTT